MKSSLIIRRQLWLFLALGIPALLASGCATPALVKGTAPRYWSPRDVPAQFLATSSSGRQEVFILFHQTTGSYKKPHDRLVAWNVGESITNVVVGRHAIRELTNRCDRVIAMPFYSPNAVPPSITPAFPGYAVGEGPCAQFTIHLQEFPEGPFTLPCSYEECRAGLRYGVMPLALAADAAIICACAIGLAGGGMSGFSVSP